MNRKITSFILFLFVSVFVNAQEVYVKTVEDFYSLKMIQGELFGQKMNFGDIKGTPYLNDEFIEGDVVSTSNTKYVGIPLRYNCYSDQMEFKGEDGKPIAVENSIVKSVIIDGKEFIYSAYSNGNKIHRSYFEIIKAGDISLLKKYETRFNEAQPAKAYQDPVPAMFKETIPQYYFKQGKSEALKITKAKEFLKMLPEHQDKMHKYLKENKLKMNNEDDLIKLFDHYNTL